MSSHLLGSIKACHKRKPLGVYARVKKKLVYLMSNMKVRTEKVEKTMLVTKEQLTGLVASFYGQPCKYCKTQLTYKNYVCDHIFPLSRGGESEAQNLQIICKRCNTQKGPMLEEEYISILGLIDTFTEESKVYVKRKLSKASI